MPDALHDGRFRALRQFLDGGLPCLTILARYAHFYQFVMIKREIKFGHHAIGQPFFAEQDDGLERVRQAAQIAFL